MIESKALFGCARGTIPFAPEGWRFIIPTAIAMIRFGSRVNCEIPADYDLNVNVNVGDRVTGGLTELARKRQSDNETGGPSDAEV